MIDLKKTPVYACPALFLVLVTFSACGGGGGGSGSGGVPPVVAGGGQAPGQQSASADCTPPPTPTPGPTPSGTKLYVTNVCLPAAGPVSGTESYWINVYDELGHQLHTTGTFPKLSRPNGAVFDNLNREIYVSNTLNNTVTAYDEAGNLVRAFSASTNGGGDDAGAIAFDPLNRQLYVAGLAITVFDESGNPIRTFGGPVRALMFDPANRRIYESDGVQILVFDENGNRVATTGNFPNTDDPVGIAFDSCNHHLYVINGGGGPNPQAPVFTVTVYDEDGNQIITAGQFPNLFFPTAIAFDISNRHLYVSNSITSQTSPPPVVVYDENGNLLPADGGFPNSHLPSGIAVDVLPSCQCPAAAR